MKGVRERNAEEFLAEADEILEGVAEDLLLLEASAGKGEPEPEVINSIFRGAHSLKGISGMFGFAQVTEVSHKMETLLDALRMGRATCSRATLDLLFEGVDLLKSLCGAIASGDARNEPKVGPFVERLLGASLGADSDRDDPIGALGLGDDVLRVLTEYEMHRLRETLRDPKRRLVRVRAGFPLSSFDADLDSLNKALKPCGEIISTLPAPGPGSDEALEFDLLVGAKSSMEEVCAVCAPFRAEVVHLAPDANRPTPAVEPLAGEEEHDPEFGLIEEHADERDPSAPAEPPAPARAESRGGADLRSLTKTIRVDLPKLDLLMNLVGELVLTKGRFQILSERLREKIGFTGDALELTKAQKELDRKLSELQQAVMDVRMIPLGQVFSKLHRVMRKILQGTNKEAELEIFGADTELDKLIVEDLSDPLVQIVRNAVDHGIEAPQVRVSRGKPPKGTIRISARQRGNHVVIEVTDDGAGLNRERIRNKAVERGLIPDGAVLEDKDLLDLVFVPGFSTREEVTEISGRGVGMDVVRRNIANLSGLIELSSAEGKGTTVTIILPITLAIIQALLVDARGQTYAIPLNSVLETLAVEPEQVKAIEGRPVLHLREQTLPLVRIDSLFGVSAGDEPPAYAVVMGIAEKRAAFAVDNLISQRDVVIKSLGRRLQSLRGIAGATDVGDQRTILVLDVATLVDQVFAAA